MASAADFTTALSRFKSERLGKIAKATQQQVARQIGTKVVRRTPVKTGRARGNWRLGFSSQLAGGEVRRFDPTGQETIRKIVEASKRLAAYSKFSLYNNTPYIQYLEQGKSSQAPLGMLRISISEVISALPEIKRNVLKELGAEINVR